MLAEHRDVAAALCRDARRCVPAALQAGQRVEVPDDGMAQAGAAARDDHFHFQAERGAGRRRGRRFRVGGRRRGPGRARKAWIIGWPVRSLSALSRTARA